MTQLLFVAVEMNCQVQFGNTCIKVVLSSLKQKLGKLFRQQVTSSPFSIFRFDMIIIFGSLSMVTTSATQLGCQKTNKQTLIRGAQISVTLGSWGLMHRTNPENAIDDSIQKKGSCRDFLSRSFAGITLKSSPDEIKN